MNLLASYGKRAQGMPVVNVVSESVIRHGAALIDLRQGTPVGSLRTIDHVWSREGRVLRNVKGVLRIVQPGGAAVDLQTTSLAVKGPVFVGEALVVKDGSEPFGVFDGTTGALRGRLTHSAKELPFLFPDRDSHHVWLSDETELTCWNVARVERTARIETPSRCFRVAVTPSGNLITSLMAKRASTVLMLSKQGTEVARHDVDHHSFCIAGDVIVVASSERPELLVFDEKLSLLSTLPMPPKVDVVELLSLPTDAREFLAVDWHNQVHQYGTGATKSPSTPEKKPSKPAKKSAAKTKKR